MHEHARQFLTVDEVHDITGFSKPTIYRGIKSNAIPHLRIAGAIRVPKTWIDSCLALPQAQ